MSNQRPPGPDEPTHDPERERPDASPRGPAPQPWVDPNRTQRYSGRRSIVDRLKGQSKEPERLVTQETVPPPPKPAPARPQVASSAQKRAALGQRSGGGPRLGLVLASVIVVGLGGGAAAAWFSGWRPGFLDSTSSEPAKTPGEMPPKPGDAKPSDAKPGAKPGDPATPPATPPPVTEIPKRCYGDTTEVKAGAAACGFALETSGALSFQGARIAERVAAGDAAAQRIVLYPLSPSNHFVFLRACAAASGRCEGQYLADTKEKKLVAVNVGGAGFAWVVWSPKETMALLGWRDHLSDTIAVVTTADGKTVRPSTVRTARNRYAIVRHESVRWRDEEAFTVEVKMCPPGKRRTRNTECEKDDDVRYRRRTVKVER